MSTLFVAEYHHGTLSPASRRAITAATQCGNPVTALLATDAVSPDLTDQLKLDGVQDIWTLEAAAFKQHLAEPWAAMIAELAQSFTHIIMAHSSFGKDVLPRAAALSHTLPFADVIDIVSPKQFKRPCYAGDIIECIESLQATQFLTVRATAFESPKLIEGDVPILSKTLTCALDSAAVFVSKDQPNSDKPSLDSAAIVLSGGRGMQNTENFKRLEKIAEHYQAAVGASRAAVDAGLIENEAQVGQTGQIVAPDVYVALGISGATQHLAGMKASKTVIAINKDPEAPIFEIADYGLQANIEDVLDEWERAL